MCSVGAMIHTQHKHNIKYYSPHFYTKTHTAKDIISTVGDMVRSENIAEEVWRFVGFEGVQNILLSWRMVVLERHIVNFCLII